MPDRPCGPIIAPGVLVRVNPTKQPLSIPRLNFENWPDRVNAVLFKTGFDIFWDGVVQEVSVNCALAPPELRSPAESIEGLTVWILSVRGLVSVNPQRHYKRPEALDCLQRVVSQSWVVNQVRLTPELFEMGSPSRRIS